MATDLQTAANDLAADKNADVIFVNTGMDRGAETRFIDAGDGRLRRENAILIVVTGGGDADVAYRIARCLQTRYKHVTAVISGQCKSAGTLLVIGAKEIAFSEHGELGPLDVQLRKADDLWAHTSGLTVMKAFDALQVQVEKAFTSLAVNIKTGSGGSITFKTAADIASKLTGGMFSHVYQQIEVMHVGEAARAMSIASEYGERLNASANNLRDGALGILIAGYPSHSFVIDQEEARLLFKNVRGISDKERAVCDALGGLSRNPASKLDPVYYLSDPPATAGEAKDDTQGTDRANPAGQDPGTAGPAASAEQAAGVDAADAKVVPITAGAAGG